MAQTRGSRQRNLVPAMKAKRTVGGRRCHVAITDEVAE
jgi:hypothetical protein